MTVAGWEPFRLDGVATERRHTVVPSEVADTVFHYSIPVFDEIGDGQKEPSAGIGSHKLLLQGGELLVSKLNPRKSRVLIAHAHEVPTVASTEFVALELEPQIESRFARYLFLSEATRQALDAQVQSVTRSQQRASTAAISKLWVDLPSPDEQQRIADRLDAETARIDALIAKRQRQIDLLEERGAAVINGIFEKGWIRRSDGVPVGVEDMSSARLGSVAGIQSGLTMNVARDAGRDARPYPYLRVANVHDGSVDLRQVTEVLLAPSHAARCQLRSGDVLMTEGGDPDKLGRGSVWAGQIDPCLHQNHIFAVRPNKDVILPSYLGLVTRTAYARAYFEMTASKTTGIASTSSSKIAAFRVPLPSVVSQKHLVESVRAQVLAVDGLRGQLLRQVALLKERRQALITAAVTGKLTIA